MICPFCLRPLRFEERWDDLGVCEPSVFLGFVCGQCGPIRELSKKNKKVQRGPILTIGSSWNLEKRVTLRADFE